MAICPECNIDKPATKKYFYFRTEAKYGTRMLSKCKLCTKKYMQRYYKKNKKPKAKKVMIHNHPHLAPSESGIGSFKRPHKGRKL